ncbi:MAG: adenylate/guanylate cyclase domain-containing protein, partial [Solirubrobacteraceae bacterium]
MRLEFGLDDQTLAALRTELVEILEVADDDGRVLTRRGAAPAASAPATPIAEASARREQVTVLLCDLATTPASEALDREALDVVIARFQAICHEVARRLDGQHQPWISDGVAVFFGHVNARDGDARRAVRCGWEIQRAIGAARDVIEREFGVPIAVRIGIATGTSRAGATGADGGDAANPFGDTPNMASRVQAIGEPGAVIVDAATHALAHEAFDFEELGSHELTGCPEPVPLFRLLEPHDGAGGDADAEPVPTAIVGRTAERALLR